MPGMLEEKDAIREVLAEYCFRLDSGWFEGMAGLFTENGTWETAFGKATGREAIAAHAEDIRARRGDERPRGIHLVANVVITFDGEAAGCSAIARSTASSPRIAPASRHSRESGNP